MYRERALSSNQNCDSVVSGLCKFRLIPASGLLLNQFQESFLFVCYIWLMIDKIFVLNEFVNRFLSSFNFPLHFEILSLLDL